MNFRFLFAILLYSCPALADGSAAAHLLKGARLFRADEYTQALVEFQVAKDLGAGVQAQLYVAATLVKLHRPEDAVELFSEAGHAASSDALLSFYRALALYDARLYSSADRVLASVGERAGPKIGAQVRTMRDRIAQTLAREPSKDTIDWYLEQGATALQIHRRALAQAYYQEALNLSKRRRSPFREQDAEEGLRAAAGEASR